jgi:hypothetical protein
MLRFGPDCSQKSHVPENYCLKLHEKILRKCVLAMLIRLVSYALANALTNDITNQEYSCLRFNLTHQGHCAS